MGSGVTGASVGDEDGVLECTWVGDALGDVVGDSVGLVVGALMAAAWNDSANKASDCGISST